MSEHVHHGYGTVGLTDEEYEGRVAFELWSAPKNTVQLQFWGMSGERSDDLDSYVYLHAEEARWFGLMLIEMSRSSLIKHSSSVEAWTDPEEQAFEEPLVDGSLDYHSECKAVQDDVAALRALDLLGYEKEGETTGTLGTAERERLREVLVEEFGYEEPDVSELFTSPPADEDTTEE